MKTLYRMNATVLLFLLAVMLSVSPAWSQNLTELKNRASRNDADAQLEIGFIYFKKAVAADHAGQYKEFQTNINEAIKWYQLSAEQGNTTAILRIGGMFREGYGLPKNEAEGLKWIRLAARRGNLNAQRLLMIDNLSW